MYYISINGIFLTSFLTSNCFLSFMWKLMDHKFLSDIFVHLESTFRSKSSPSLAFTLLVALAYFGSKEQRHCNLICSIIRLTLGFFKTSLKQVKISLFPLKHIGKNSISAIHTKNYVIRLPMSTSDQKLYPDF